VQAKWAEMAPLIDRMMERTGTEGEFPVEAGTSLAGDDRASAPYHVSHVVMQCLVAGVDHMHAAKTLVVDQHVLHLAAPSSLARGALENFAAAYWVLGPINRQERLERALRWHYQNVRDQHTALDVRLQLQSTREEQFAKLDSVAIQNSLDPKPLRAGYVSTTAVTYCEEHLGSALPLGVALPWRICSGLAHGRPWAYLGALRHEEFPSGVEGIVHLRLTSSLELALYPLLAAMQLLQELLRERERRALRA